MALRNGWKVDKSNPDTERYHINLVLKEIQDYTENLDVGVLSVTEGTGIDVDNTDPANPIVALDSGSQASLDLADSALQPGEAEPPITAGTTAQFYRGDKVWSDTLTSDIIVANNVRIGNGFSGVTSNLAIGPFAMSVASTGTSNTAIGAQALGYGSSGNSNTALGHEALRVNTGNSNTAIGRQAMRNNLTGAANTAVGLSSLVNNDSGNFNVGVGQSSLLGNTTGIRNVAVGYDAGRTGTSANANVSGNDNTYIGYRSGPASPAQRSFATGIGSGSVVDSSNTIVLGRAANEVTVIGAIADSGGGCKLQVTGHIGALGAGNGLRVAEGSNAKQGIATLVAGTVTVANTSVTANSRIFLTTQDPNGGTVGTPYVASRIAGTSFTINSTDAGDTSIVAYEIFEPGT